MRRSTLLAAVLTTTALVSGGCTTTPPDAPPTATGAVDGTGADAGSSGSAEDGGTEEPDATSAAREPAVTATAVTAEVTALDSPDGAPVETFTHPTATGAPLTFLVLEEQDGWVQVQLPVRPNGTTGWLPAEAVELAAVPYRLEIDTAANELTLVRGGVAVRTFRVAAGTGDTPTPTGTFYVTELLAPTNPGYGPFAYGLSAFSDVLNEFGGGPGQIGLHGTDDEGTIGQDVSHGCIRLANADITALTEILPLGTPVVIS
nr:L,D-transpeptidase family protein [uncultured Actinotalea sp.]